MEFSLNIKGLDGVRRHLLDLSPKLRNKIIRKGLKAAMEPVLARTKELVPVRTGLLRASLNIRYRTREKGNLLVAQVWGNYGIAPHLHLLEFGHKQVATARQGGGRGTGKIIGPFVQARPGPRGFLRAAADEHEGQVAETLIATVNEALEELGKG